MKDKTPMHNKIAKVPVTPHTMYKSPDKLFPQQIAAGICPHCGKLDNWLNDIPLSVFCWGTEEKPHRQWRKVVPRPFNPNLSGYDKNARPAPIPGLIDMSPKAEQKPTP